MSTKDIINALRVLADISPHSPSPDSTVFKKKHTYNIAQILEDLDQKHKQTMESHKMQYEDYYTRDVIKYEDDMDRKRKNKLNEYRLVAIRILKNVFNTTRISGMGIRYEGGTSGDRTSGSSVGSADNYVSRRNKAISKEQAMMPDVKREAHIPEYSENKNAISLFGVIETIKYTIGTKNILLCSDVHNYDQCYKDSIYLLDWVRAMCVFHQDKKLMLLIEHPPHKSVYPPIYHELFHAKIAQGHMFGPTWKLRNKLKKTITNLEIKGVDLRFHEYKGRAVFTSLRILKTEILNYASPHYTVFDMIVNPTNYTHLSSNTYITQFSRIINDALDKSTFSNDRINFFTSLMYAYGVKNTYTEDKYDMVIMDVYCLATMFGDDDNNNIIVNAGGAHVDIYVNFINHYFKTRETFKKDSFTTVSWCVKFDKPYDFLE